MATWHGTPRKFTLERYHPENYGYGNYELVEFNWRYGTVSDILTITETDSKDSKEISFDKQQAEAMLCMLAQWYSRYEGVEDLKLLIKDSLEEK